MNNKTHKKVLLRVLVALLAVTLLFGMFAAPQAEASSYKASYIDLVEGLQLDVTEYLDSDVAYQLPESVQDDEMISIIEAWKSNGKAIIYVGHDPAEFYSFYDNIIFLDKDFKSFARDTLESDQIQSERDFVDFYKKTLSGIERE